MKKKTIRYTKTKVLRAYLHGDWDTLNQLVNCSSAVQVRHDLVYEFCERRPSSTFFWGLATRLRESGLKPNILQKLGCLILTLAAYFGNEMPDLDELNKWKAVLDLSRVDFRTVGPGGIEDGVFRILAQWVVDGVRADLAYWASAAVGRRFPDSVALLQPCLDRHPKSLARFQVMLQEGPLDNLEWYERLMADIRAKKKVLSTPEQHPMETQLDLI